MASKGKTVRTHGVQAVHVSLASPLLDPRDHAVLVRFDLQEGRRTKHYRLTTEGAEGLCEMLQQIISHAKGTNN